MRLWVIMLLYLTAFSSSCFAGGGNGPAGGRSAGLSNSSVALSDLWSAFNNQAGLAGLKSPAAGLYYENRFLLKELGYKAAVFAYPLKEGTLVTCITNFGFEAWNESKAGLAYARSFGKYFSLGAQLDFLHIQKDEPYGNRNIFTFEVGILSKLTPKLTLGAHIYNPVNAGISQATDERLPAIFRLGAAYTVSDKFLITAEVKKNMNQNPDFISGFEFRVLQCMHIRAGVNTGLSLISFGVGLNYRKFILDFSSSYHQVLGFSPQSSLTYNF